MVTSGFAVIAQVSADVESEDVNGVKTIAGNEEEQMLDSQEARTSWAVDFLSYIILVGGLAAVGLAAYMVVVTFSSLPAWDGWIEIHFEADRANQSTLAWLWNQHYEHRLVIPKLLLLVDLCWFHATQAFLLVSIFVIQLLHLLVLGWSMRVLGGWRGAVWRTGFGLAAFCLFCLSQWENLTWGFQTCFVLSGLFATLAFLGLILYWMRSREARRGSWKYLLLSIAAALGATYSLSNGNLVWPLWLGGALLLRLRRPVATAVFLVGAASTTLYLNDYVHPSTTFFSPQIVSTLFRYLATYFGSSWVQSTRDIFRLPESTIRWAESIGTAGLVLFVFLLLKLRSYVRLPCPFCIQLILTLLFCVGTGMVTALGRFFLGVGQAFASRYQTVSMLFWCCLALLCLAALLPSGRSRRNDFLLPMQVVLLSSLLFSSCLAGTTLTHARIQGFQRNVAAMALLTGVHDAKQLRWADYHPDNVLSLLPYLERERLSVFSGSQFTLLGKTVNSVSSSTSSNDCLGEVESVTEITTAWPRSFRVTGWAWDTKDRRPPAEVVIAVDGIITGLGAVGDWRPEQETDNARITSHFTGFAGYVRDVPKSSAVEIYAVLRKPQLIVCHIATFMPEKTDRWAQP